METLSSTPFWLNFLYFLIAVTIANFIPGDTILRLGKIKLSV